MWHLPKFLAVRSTVLFWLNTLHLRLLVILKAILIVNSAVLVLRLEYFCYSSVCCWMPNLDINYFTRSLLYDCILGQVLLPLRIRQTLCHISIWQHSPLDYCMVMVEFWLLWTYQYKGGIIACCNFLFLLRIYGINVRVEKSSEFCVLPLGMMTYVWSTYLNHSFVCLPNL